MTQLLCSITSEICRGRIQRRQDLQDDFMDLGDPMEDYMEDHDVIAWSSCRNRILRKSFRSQEIVDSDAYNEL